VCCRFESFFGSLKVGARLHHNELARDPGATAKDNVDFFRKYYGPTLKTFESLPASGREALEREMIELNRRFDLNGGKGGPVAIAADYLETVIVRA
jgi:hypothetical protein